MKKNGFAKYQSVHGFAPILILIIIVVLGVGFYFVKLNEVIPTPPALPSPIPTATSNSIAGWKTYTNSDYQVKYPGELFVRRICPGEELLLAKRNSTETRQEIISTDECAREFRFTIEVMTDPNIGNQSTSDEDYSIDKKEVTVSGIKTTKYTHTPVHPDQGAFFPGWFQNVLINQNGKIYELYLSNKELEGVFDQILSTFRFLK